MRAKPIIFVLLLFLWALPPALQAQSTEMTLNECLEYAYENNQDLLNASLEIDAQKAVVGETVSDGLPQINASVDLSHNLKPQKTFLPGELIDPSGESDGQFVPVQFSPNYSGQAAISLNQMVFRGSYFVGLKAAKTYKELSTKAHIKSKIDITEAVTKAYYNVLVSKELLKSIEANNDRLDTLLRETKIMYENGFAEKIDINRITVEKNNMQTNLNNQQRLYDISYQLLKFQMGMPLENEIVITETISDLELDYMKQLNEGVNYSRRIEYSQLQTQQRLEELNIRNYQVQYLPSLDFYGNVGWIAGPNDGGDLFEFDSDTWLNFQTIGLKLTIPIFDGLYKSYKIQQARIDLEKTNNNLTMMRNNINLQVQNTRTTLLNNVANANNQKDNMALAEEVYDVTKEKYQNGVGSNLELIEADSDFVTAQTNYYSALYDAFVALVEYQKALGILLEEQN